MRETSTASERNPTVGDTVAGWRLIRPLPALIPGTLSFVGVANATTPTATASEHWHGFDSAEPPALMHRRINLASTPAGQDALVRDAQARYLHGGEFVRTSLELLRAQQLRLTVAPVTQDVPYSILVTAMQQLTPGEIVTLLVPLAETVATAHRAGVSHGSLTLRVCRIDAAGHPWFEDWSRSVELGELSGMRRDLVIIEDLRATARICEAIITLSSEPVPLQVSRLVTALSGNGSGAGSNDTLVRLIDALFAWASPQPVGVERSAATPRAEPNTRIVLEPLRDDAPLVTPAPSRTMAAIVAQARILRGHLGTVRPVFWLALCGAGAALSITATLL